MSLRLDIGVVCDIGGADPQKGNEDTYFIYLPAHAIGVIDGMGGPGDGRLAADMVSTAFQGLMHIEEPDESILAAAVRDANSRVLRANKTARRKPGNRMGAVGTIAWIDVRTGTTLIAQVGDSRAYVHSDGSIEQKTVDQTPLAGMNEAQRMCHPHKHHIQYAFGLKEQLPADYYQISLTPGDTLLLCSDGLTDYVGSTTLIRILDMDVSAQKIAYELLKEALRCGTCDNVTAIVVKVLPDKSLAGAGQTLCPV
ncbi:serine/threonine-protein phosphatase [Candidatus Uhrbacteria bacterium]|jgi:PPM family protein phosphatase|nr:serine/threonine-protein phosphatase [Candidatus Uhrbacteria bacterium]MBT7717611.1 serine/threonine-protein phosphatase [Candidatus Uhrbacteria bacterium]